MQSDAVAQMRTGVVCGVETGQILITGAPDQDDWSLPGEIERQAASLAHAGAPGTIVLGDATCRHLRDEIEVEMTPQGHVLRTAPKGRAGIMGRAAGTFGGFVGRAAELAFLATSFKDAKSG
jgi:hypothetical protein